MRNEMKTEMKTEMREQKTSRVQAVGAFLNRNALPIAVFSILTVMLCSSLVFATPSADSMWTSLVNTLTKWLGRLGGAIIFVGGIMFGHGWLNQDPASKTNGLNVIIGGAIVLAVVALAGTFLV